MVDTIEDRRAAHAAIMERRRSGRKDYDNPSLVGLLRGQLVADVAKAEVDAAELAPSIDDLAPARGILTALFVGAAMWAAIFGLWFFV